MSSRSGATSHTGTGRKILRVVIDTNVLVSALIFKSNAMQPIRRAWQSGACIPIVSRETAEELIAAIRYPKFALDREDQEHILIEYLPWCETLAEPRTRVKLPSCRDIDDQPFLLLAAASGADILVTGDKDLLALGKLTRFEILKPAELVSRMVG